ncbi:MAG: hypothetical protein ACTJHT_16085 [Sphingobacterium sp.]
MLVIKYNNLEYGAEAVPLYKDARTNQGTILALDFSSRTCVVGNGISSVNLPNDLSAMDIVNFGYTFTEAKTLTSKKGIHVSQDSIVAANQHGLIFNDIMDYILANPTHNIGMTIWAMRDSTIGGPGERFLRCLGGLGNFDLSIDDTTTQFRIAGGSHTQTVSANIDRIVQYSMTYTPDNSRATRGINGNIFGAMTTVPTGWQDLGELGVGKLEESVVSRSPVVMYRMLIEDLTVSGQSEEDFVLKDYNYVNALGEYSGIEKRPFSNI